MSRDSSLSNQIQYDVTRVALKSARESVREHIRTSGYLWEESEDFWNHFGETDSTDQNSTLVVADLSKIARRFLSCDRHKWIASVRMSRPYFIALVRTRSDTEYAYVVEDLLRHSDLRLSLCKSPGAADLEHCVFEAANILNSHGILDVKYIRESDCLWVLYGDGVSGLIQWSDLDMSEIRKDLIPESTTKGSYGASIEILTKDGTLLEIDSDVVKAHLSPRHAAILEAAAESVHKEVGLRIKSRRSAAGMTQIELGKRINIDQAIISKIERGLHQPRIDTLRRIASGLNLGLNALLVN